MDIMQQPMDISLMFGFRRIYVGFSGGADSTALLLLLDDMAKSADSSKHSNHTMGKCKGKYNTGKSVEGINPLCGVEAVHFEHGIRGEESIADALWCEKLCEVRNIPFRRIDLNIGSDIANTEAVARTMRLDKWREIVDPENEAVALGQHADDRIENLFLRLMRGSNSTGLTSLRASQKIGDITFLRPLINMRRSEIEEFLYEYGVTDWRTDQTNVENRYRRNFIRNKLMPMLNSEFPNCDKALIKSISALEDDASYLEKSSEDVYHNISDKSAIFAKYFADMHLALRPRVLRLWLSDVCGYDVVPTADFMARFNDMVANFAEKSISIPLNSNISLCIEGEMLSVCLADTKVPECAEITWNWKTQSEIEWNGAVFSVEIIGKVSSESVNDRACNCVYFDVAKMPEKLIVRHRRDGDRMIPFAKSSSVKVKKLLQDTNLKTSEKQNVPIVTTQDDTVLWIPGVRRANFANISESSNCILKLISCKTEEK